MKTLIERIKSIDKILIIITLGVVFFYEIAAFIKGIPIVESILFFLLSCVMFFVGWGMMFLVLGFQAISPFCPKPIFKFFCYFFIAFLSISYIPFGFFTIYSAIFINENNIPISILPAILGMLFSSIRLYNKYFNNAVKVE